VKLMLFYYIFVCLDVSPRMAIYGRNMWGGAEVFVQHSILLRIYVRSINIKKGDCGSSQQGSYESQGCMGVLSSVPVPWIVLLEVVRTMVGRDSSVDITTRYNSKVGRSIPGGNNSFSNRPDIPRGTTNFLYNGYWVITGRKAAGAWP
jgi:hypothetical protein